MSRPLPRYTNTTHADLAKIVRITQDYDPNPPTTTSATLPGDQRRLRGIPIQARGVPGTSPGTNPATETERRNP